jgi:thiamine pyrophosphokinase
VINYLYRSGYTQLICADGGANKAYQLKLIPSVIIGDLDSIYSGTLKHFSGKTKIIKIVRQDDTDVEKCLKYLIKKNISDVILLGVTGDRLDHTFCNLGIVLKFYDKIRIRIIAENSVLVPISGKIKIKTNPGEVISFYGFDVKTKITTKGLKYPLKKECLPFGVRESTSNVAIKDEIELDIVDGIIFMIREFNVMKKYGLFQ